MSEHTLKLQELKNELVHIARPIHKLLKVKVFSLNRI